MSNPDNGGAKQQSAHPAAALGQLRTGRSHATVRAAKARVSTTKVAQVRSSHVTATKVAQARQTPATSKDDHSAIGPKGPDPCRLVSLSEAQTITGGAITKRLEAPLGPTCIYSGQGRSAGVTLAVETASFSRVTRHMTARKQFVIKGHQSVCGRLGSQILFVRLARYQLLTVTAPCGIARRFATVAVSRLSA